MRRRSLEEVMTSKSVVVIGASTDERKSGSQLLYVLKRVGFKGQIAGVNPRGGEVFGVPLYRNIQEVPFPVDLVVFHIPPAGCLPRCGNVSNGGSKG